MNYIRQLTGFFLRVADDDRLNPTHVSLYMAIFQFWNLERFRNPVSISRQELMRISKICAKATYHKCIKDLHNYGYIRYQPSYNPFKGSLVYLFDLQSSNEQELILHHTNIETSIEQAVAPYINNINITKQNDENETTPKNEIVVKVSKRKAKVIEVNGQKVEAKNEKVKGSCPTIEEAKAYFLIQSSTETEAQKFHNYFQSNGWKVGGKTPMQDWQAAARNWILNAPSFNQSKPANNQLPQPGNLSITINKDYSEPL